ncbi:MAG: TetR/AcrR family transcriptional regulator [Corynebacteriales bacterium]|nr:TetR/AcrR family transcriptional regulator [Mycobacteriales bacterium]
MATKQQQREETTKALIATARRLFAADGYAVTSLEAIARETGVTKGALYHHFGSKQGLFNAVLAQVQEEVASEVARAAEAQTTLWAGLIEGCAAFLDASSNPKIQQIMLIDGPAVLGWHQWRQLDEASSAKHLSEALHALIEEGIIRSQPVEPLAHLLSGAMNEAALWLAESDDRPADLAHARAALTMMLEALRS